jgi:acyl carrier protein
MSGTQKLEQLSERSMRSNGLPLTGEAFVHAMVRWLNQRFGRALGVTFDADTALFAGGLINSIRVLELIAWTEQATQRVIPDSQIRMDHFRTVRVIAQTFARESEEVVRVAR